MQSTIYFGASFHKNPKKLSAVVDTFVHFINTLREKHPEFESFSYLARKKKGNEFFDKSLIENTNHLRSKILEKYIKEEADAFFKEYGEVLNSNTVSRIGFDLSIATQKLESRPENEIWLFLNYGASNNSFEYGGSLVLNFFNLYAFFLATCIDFMEISLSSFDDIVHMGFYSKHINHLGVDQGKYRIGWVTYFCDKIELPVLPDYVKVTTLPKGKIVIIEQEPFDFKNENHKTKLLEVSEVFKNKYPSKGGVQ